MSIDRIFMNKKSWEKLDQNYSKKLLICWSVLIQLKKMKKTSLKMKLNKKKNKILVLLQPLKKRKILSTNSGKISEKISNSVWSKISKTERTFQFWPDGILLTIFLNFLHLTNTLLEWNKVKRIFSFWVAKTKSLYCILHWSRN